MTGGVTRPSTPDALTIEVPAELLRDPNIDEYMNILPISIDGSSLGQRHHKLNKLVDEAVHSNVSVESIKQELTSPPLDRLFKIKIASKYKNTDYIVQCLQDEDMLYVSEALKNIWFIQEARDVIQPAFLEENLYPNMSTSAISKIKNKIYLHLNDETQCEQFHKYYKKDNLKYALKFLPKCSEAYILSEMESIPEEITAHYLKLLCEKTPRAAHLYFEKIVTTSKGHCTYMDRPQGKRAPFGRSNDSKNYLREIKFLLKLSPQIYIDILEKYFCDNIPLSARLTRYFMRHHKDKFFSKSELYMSKILNVTEIARHLTKEEIKDVVIKAARAEYLGSWFNYKKVEPLLKRLEKKDKSAFKRKIFVDKEFGTVVKEPPYPFPKQPELLDDGAFSLGDLPEDQSCLDDMYYDIKGEGMCFASERMMKCAQLETRRTLLDELFDKYRFWNFSKTFYELRKRLAIESDPKNRMMIMNVLVSKSGGLQEQVATLLEFLVTRHRNEPSHVRAAVVRSLVRRAHVYRLSDTIWSDVDKFVRDVPPVECEEFIHGDILRHALRQLSPPESLVKHFLNNYSSLVDYSITPAEKKLVRAFIFKLLVERCRLHLDSKETWDAKGILHKLFDLLDDMRVKVEDSPGVIDLVKSYVDIEKKDSEELLSQLYDKKTCRKIFFKENFEFLQKDESYINVLKHDANFLNDTKKFQKTVEDGALCHERFFKKLSIYFSNDIAVTYLTVLENSTEQLKHNNLVRIVRSICILKGANVVPLMKMQPSTDRDKKLTTIYRQNIHLVRPRLSAKDIVLEEIGTIGIANMMSSVSANNTRDRLPALLTVRGYGLNKLALALSFKVMPTEQLAEVLKTTRKRITALKLSLAYMRQQGDKLKLVVYQQIKTLILAADLKDRKKLLNDVTSLAGVPHHVRHDYCMAVYTVLRKMNLTLCNYNLGSQMDLSNEYQVLTGLYENMFRLDPQFMEETLEDFIKRGVDVKSGLVRFQSYNTGCQLMYVKLLTVYLLTSTTLEQQKERMEKFAIPLLLSIKKSWVTSEKDRYTFSGVKQVLMTFLRQLKSTKAFMNESYVSVIPLCEQVLNYLKEFLPVERHFQIYTRIHLIMIYYKSVKQTVKQWPQILEDKPLKRDESIENLGYVFGMYVARELRELEAQYFSSVTWMYKTDFADFIISYCGFGKPVQKFRTAILRGLVSDRQNTSAIIFATVLMKDWCSQDEELKEFEFINELDSKEAKFYNNTQIELFV